MKRIVVFAANECWKDKEKYYYSLAFRTGKLLAEAGFVVVTGGGPGLMNEVLRGAYESHGKTVGICINIRDRFHSEFITTKEVFDELIPRQERLLSLADGFIALPGGVGTVYEIMEVIALKRKKEISTTKPLLLVDGYYHKFQYMIESMVDEGFANQLVYSYYSLLSTPEQAVQKLISQFK